MRKTYAHHLGALLIVSTLLLGHNLYAQQQGSLPPKRLPDVIAQAPGPELSAPTPSAQPKAKRISLGKGDKSQRLEPLTLEQITIKEAILDPSKADDQKLLSSQHSLSLNKSALAFSADFSTFHKRNNNPQLVSVHDGRITYYNGTHQVVRLDGVQLLGAKTLKQLELTQSVTPVQLIQDGSTQLLVYRKVKNTKGDILYKVTLYKLFGRYFGKAFEQTIATQRSGQSQLVNVAKVEFLRGEANPFIRITPISPGGDTLTSQAQILRYNGWEGLYRIPAPVHTAPKRDSRASL